MPEIVIQHRDSVEIGSVWRILVARLKEECSERFSVPEHPVTPEDFGILDSHVTGGSDPTHDVIIRILLHAFEKRVQNGDSHAQALVDTVNTLLNTQEWVEHRGRVTVGVSLVFAEVAWAAK